jgi:hypothetical protein
MDILSQIQSQLGGSALDGLARQIGAGRGETERAVGAALPMLLGGLARNAASSPAEARSLARALDEDHDPSLVDQLGGLFGGGGGGDAGGGLAGALGSLLGGGAGGAGGGGLADLAGALLGGGGPSRSKALDGAGILRHVFGQRRGAVEGGVGRASGLDAGQVGQLLILLAPMVMSALARVKQQRHLDERGLTDVLRRERREIEERTPGLSRGGLRDLLDRDDDGQVGDDIASLGAGLARAFFNR